eukprot:11217724-Lingulodinium_polyedra.AAC.1
MPRRTATPEPPCPCRCSPAANGSARAPSGLRRARLALCGRILPQPCLKCPCPQTAGARPWPCRLTWRLPCAWRAA